MSSVLMLILSEILLVVIKKIIIDPSYSRYIFGLPNAGLIRVGPKVSETSKVIVCKYFGRM